MRLEIFQLILKLIIALNRSNSRHLIHYLRDNTFHLSSILHHSRDKILKWEIQRFSNFPIFSNKYLRIYSRILQLTPVAVSLSILERTHFSTSKWVLKCQLKMFLIITLMSKYERIINMSFMIQLNKYKFTTNTNSNSRRK